MKLARARELQAQLAKQFGAALNLSEPGSHALGAWFLGPKSENQDLLLGLLKDAVSGHALFRRDGYPHDPPWLTEERRKSDAYVEAVKQLEGELGTLVKQLRGSVPFFSYRYQGHMLWDVTLPAVLGTVAALLYNQNNVAAEASPVTTWLEMLVGDDLCRMLGFYVPAERGPDGNYKDPDPTQTVAWGHITCGGTVANCEAAWAARNAKYAGLAVAAALKQEPELLPALNLEVKLADGSTARLRDLDAWALVNLDASVVVALPERIHAELGIPETTIADVLGRYSVQHLGLVPFLREFAPSLRDPVLLVPSTAHYSWPKAASLVGLGRSSTRAIAVDLDARLDIAALDLALEVCLKSRTPVLMAVSVLGTTEENAIDPLRAVLDLRQAYRKRGLDFWVHVDGAWGGYFASMLRPPVASAKHAPRSVSKMTAEEQKADANVLLYGAEMAMSRYVEEQYRAIKEADSVTIDPHKAGYVPYPAGGLCYRDGAMRHLVAFSAPVVYHGGLDPTVGVFGIEGSKPGAAAAAVYLSHRVIRTDQSGYGRILGRCLWNSKRLYCQLVTMAEPEDRFRVVVLQRLPSERGLSEMTVEEELDFIRKQILPLSNEDLVEFLNQKGLTDWFRELGSDQLILSYAFNVLAPDGRPNTDVRLTNKLNQEIFKRLSLARRNQELPPLFVTASTLDSKQYGPLVTDLKRRLGVVDPSGAGLEFLISTTMDPWLTDTEKGNLVPELIGELRREVTAIIKDWPPPGS